MPLSKGLSLRQCWDSHMRNYSTPATSTLQCWKVKISHNGKFLQGQVTETQWVWLGWVEQHGWALWTMKPGTAHPQTPCLCLSLLVLLQLCSSFSLCDLVSSAFLVLLVEMSWLWRTAKPMCYCSCHPAGDAGPKLSVLINCDRGGMSESFYRSVAGPKS